MQAGAKHFSAALCANVALFDAFSSETSIGLHIHTSCTCVIFLHCVHVMQTGAKHFSAAPCASVAKPCSTGESKDTATHVSESHPRQKNIFTTW